MNQINIFSSGKDSIDIKGLDSLVQFSRYDPKKQELFLDGIELYEDLKIRFGSVLYAKGTKITPERIDRLLQLRESNPTLNLFFKLKRNVEIIQTFRNEIREQFFSLVNRQTKTLAFKNLISSRSLICTQNVVPQPPVNSIFS